MLSCAPKWAHPSPSALPWRDHWMQAVYYPLTKIHVDVSVDKELGIVSNHDEYCLWFDVRKDFSNIKDPIPMPMPTAGLHNCVSRLRLGQINDSQRNSKYTKCLRKMLEKYVALNQQLPSNILCISDLTLLPLMAAALVSEFEIHDKNSTTKIIVCESSLQMRNFVKLFKNKNESMLRNVEIVYFSSTALELEAKDLPHKVSFWVYPRSKYVGSNLILFEAKLLKIIEFLI